MFYSK